ncbi:Acg family FMN-binding oxidoreductase [Mycolicibacterium sp. P9-22]|uniref:Acg family FMN-binding oxidoreductase n=1 Tax=Mycolicibacterium sp. P9-22 TaxID=2024613 RepID=UPI0011F022C8|nr:NAD(P)H nitroreductase [Mycolicibacterium sp. P9-22]KAA0118324.1 NAD(P)H nitroreductase [Mycolicibacterium sp. P9-22]
MSRSTTWPNALREALQQACRAPSYHNSQPWRWVLGDDTLELHLDPRRLVASDTSGRQALLSCGAVLDHFRVASAAAGWTIEVDRYPNPNDHKHLATIAFTHMAYITEGHRRRAEAMRHRRTDRLPFAAPTDWESLEPLLRRAVGESALVDVLGADAYPTLCKAAELSESERLYDSPYHADLHWWTSVSDPTAGIPHSSLVTAAESDRVGIGRQFPVTHHREQRATVPQDEARVIVLSTIDDTSLDVLGCGEALSAALLSATMSGLASCTLSHLTEVPSSCAVVRELTGRGVPQLLVRIGATPSDEPISPPTPRRPLTDVLTIRR